ncbi:MAG TPA: alpha/beta hydrolase [Chthoniobacteraceae bacterium]|jgi:acetyl esterase|nr:alpha/beta hydrolase [Chthoniobacteraceae bacterium]
MIPTYFLAQTPPPPADPAQLDEDSVAFLKQRPTPPAVTPPPEVLRENYRRARLTNQPALPQVDRVKEYEAKGPRGAIPLRMFRGAATADLAAPPVLVFFHGGGWMLGDLDTHDWHCRSIANAAACVVVAVDYRLAPEHVFPAAFDDALAAVHWIAANSALLKIDPARLSVGGDSAGGNLAAGVALSLRDEGVKLKAQILIYPAVDLSMSGNYYGRFTKNLILTDDSMRMFIDHYVPDAALRKDRRASPLLAPSLQGLPPTLIVQAGFDPLAAEGSAYAARLEQEGVPTSMQRYPGQMHGFLSNARLLPKALDAVKEIGEFLKAKQ